LPAPLHRPPEEAGLVRQRRIRAKKPWRAGLRQNVDITHAEHHFRLAVKQHRMSDRGLLERQHKRLVRRVATGSADLIGVGLAHSRRNIGDMRRIGSDDVDPIRQSRRPA
jgi:hypothetical protein